MKNISEKKQLALEKLMMLRKGSMGYSDCLETIESIIHNTELTLEDIGTSKEELEHCRVLGCKTNALAWLNVLRKGTNRPGEFLIMLEEDMRLGKLTYVDIGTTQQEVSSFGRPLRPPMDPALAVYFA